MASGKLVTSLVDVELHLQEATLAVKLHLNMLLEEPRQHSPQSRESKHQIATLSNSIEEMQSELGTVISEILAVAAKSLAVDTSELKSSGEETETEDEMEFEEEKATVPVDDEAISSLERGFSSGIVKSEPEPPHQSPTTVPSQQGDCTIEVELNTDANEDMGTTYGESGHVDSENKKRPRLGLDNGGREVKCPTRCDVVGAVERYARFTADVLRQYRDNRSAVPPETALLKKTATETNAAVLKCLEAGQSFDEETRSTFSVATKQVADVICGISKDAVESSWIEGTLDRITNIARFVTDDALLQCASRLRKRLVKNYGYATYQEGDSNLDAIEERVECYKRDARQLKAKAIARPICSITTRLVKDLESLASKGFVRTEENWARFAALGDVVAEWIAVGQGSKKVKMQAKYFRGLSQQLSKLDSQYPGRLPPALLRNTKRLS